jgi:hypothetical protein
MGKLICGCEITPGEPVTPEMVEAHKEHTLHCMFIWDIMARHNATPKQEQAREKLIEARIAYQEALDAAYP